MRRLEGVDEAEAGGDGGGGGGAGGGGGGAGGDRGDCLAGGCLGLLPGRLPALTSASGGRAARKVPLNKQTQNTKDRVVHRGHDIT